VEIHADFSASERNPLHLESQSLLPAFFSGQRNPSASTYHAMPRQFIRPLEGPNSQARRAGKPGGQGDLTVGNHLASGHIRDHASEPDQRGQISDLRCGWYDGAIA
jgi:hypothetical protein